MISHSRIPVTQSESVHLVRLTPTKSPRGVIVFSHGFLVPGFESHRMFYTIAKEAVGLGWESIIFDYRGAGYSDREFVDMTIDTEIEDLHAVLDHVRSAATCPIFVWGQSLGSTIACHVASCRADVNGLILWAISAKLYERFRARPGFLNLATAPRAYLDSGFEIGRPLLESMKNKDTYGAMTRISTPTLLVHGDADDKATVGMSHEAFRALSGPKKLLLISGGNHAFKRQPNHFREAVDGSFSWLDSLVPFTA